MSRLSKRSIGRRRLENWRRTKIVGANNVYRTKQHTTHRKNRRLCTEIHPFEQNNDTVQHRRMRQNLEVGTTKRSINTSQRSPWRENSVFRSMEQRRNILAAKIRTYSLLNKILKFVLTSKVETLKNREFAVKAIFFNCIQRVQKSNESHNIVEHRELRKNPEYRHLRMRDQAQRICKKK